MLHNPTSDVASSNTDSKQHVIYTYIRRLSISIDIYIDLSYTWSSNTCVSYDQP